jgi:hypothetical protein
MLMTSRSIQHGLADAMGVPQAQLERACRVLVPGGAWPVGNRRAGPTGLGVQSIHLVALILGQAGALPSDSLEAFQTLQALAATDVLHTARDVFLPPRGVRLDEYCACVIEGLAMLAEADLMGRVERLEAIDWTLTVCLRPVSAFLSWTIDGVVARVDFCPSQPELLEASTPRQVKKSTDFPFRVFAVAAQLHAQNEAGRRAPATVSLSKSGSTTELHSESENAAPSARTEAAHFQEVKTAQTGRNPNTHVAQYAPRVHISQGARSGLSGHILT